MNKKGVIYRRPNYTEYCMRIFRLCLYFGANRFETASANFRKTLRLVVIDPRNFIFVDVQYLIITIILMRSLTINLLTLDTVIFIESTKIESTEQPCCK